MKITVTTPSGNIGSKLVQILLTTSDAQVTVLARNAKKVEPLAAHGARVVAGDQLDPAALDRALEGAEVLFWLTGVDYSTTDVRARYNQFADAASARYAGRNLPGMYDTLVTRPDAGMRFTCTSSGERKMDTRTAGPTHSSTSSTTPVTRPSAGDSTAPAMTGTRRSGSRKKPSDASVAAANGRARRRRRETNRPAASAAGTATNGQPSRASGILFIVTSAAA